jgi:hypothetical protein
MSNTAKNCSGVRLSQPVAKPRFSKVLRSDGLSHGLSTKTICSVDYPTVFAGLLLFH